MFFPGVINRVCLDPRGGVLIIIVVDFANMRAKVRDPLLKADFLYLDRRSWGRLDMHQVNCRLGCKSSMDGGPVHYIY